MYYTPDVHHTCCTALLRCQGSPIFHSLLHIDDAGGVHGAAVARGERPRAASATPCRRRHCRGRRRAEDVIGRDHAERCRGIVPGGVGECGGPRAAEGVVDGVVTIGLEIVGAGEHEGGAHLQVWARVDMQGGAEHGRKLRMEAGPEESVDM